MQMNRLTSADFDKMIIESIDEVYCFDRETDDLLFFFDQVKNGEITSESDVVYAEGRQGVQLAAFDRNKTAGFTCENGYVQAGAIAVQLGSDLVSGSTEYEVMETLKSSKTGDTFDGAFTTSETPSKVIGVYLLGDDGTAKQRLAKGEYVLAGSAITTYTFTINDDTTTPGDYALVNGEYISSNIPADYDGHRYNRSTSSTEYEDVLVHYTATSANGKKIINAGDKFSQNIKLVINFVAQEPCGGHKYLMQCVMPNAKASGTFSLSAGDNPAVHNFEASALLDICSKDKELFYIVMV